MIASLLEKISSQQWRLVVAISNNDVQQRLIVNIARAVGKYLYHYNRGTPQSIPAVHKEKDFQNGVPVPPEYPFITVDILNTPNPYELPLSEGWVNDNGEDKYVLQETRTLQYVVRVHGDGNIDINQISNDLKMKLKAQRYIDDMLEIGAGYYRTSSIIKVDQKLTTEYMEISQFNIAYNVTDYTEFDQDDGAHEISQVEVDTNTHKNEDGEAGLYKSKDDPDPLQIDTELIP